MMNELWLPKRHRIAEGVKIRSLRFGGEGWRIYNTSGAENLLVVLPSLAERWVDQGLLDASMLHEFSFGAASYWSLASHPKCELAPIDKARKPHCKEDALAFSFALMESRKRSEGVSFHDALYLEQFSRILPTYTETPPVEDSLVVGRWLSGGVDISTRSFRRLSQLTGWMSPEDLAECVGAAGLEIPKSEAPSPKNIPDAQNEKGVVGFSLPGRAHLEQFFQEQVIDIVLNPEKYHNLGIGFPSAIVLHGPPGCGKTFAVDRLVEFLGWPTYSIDSSSVGSSYLHETSKRISDLFDKALSTAPSIIIIDEMEAFLSDRNAGGGFNLHHVEEVSTFLRRIPEAIQRKVLILAMTNQIEWIDPAILRRGRFDHILEVGPPSREETESLLHLLLGKLPKEDALDAESMLDALTGRPLSDSTFVIREASRLAAKAGYSRLDQDCIKTALQNLLQENGNRIERIGFVLDS